jgi:hypothetical protein
MASEAVIMQVPIIIMSHVTPSIVVLGFQFQRFILLLLRMESRFIILAEFKMLILGTLRIWFP